MSHHPTLWTTLRDFVAIVLGCIVGAIALYALVGNARAEGLPPPAYELPPPGPRAGWTACVPDIQHFCPNIPPGGGRILACLAGNKDRLSGPCRDALIRAWTFYHR